MMVLDCRKMASHVRRARLVRGEFTAPTTVLWDEMKHVHLTHKCNVSVCDTSDNLPAHLGSG